MIKSINDLASLSEFSELDIIRFFEKELEDSLDKGNKINEISEKLSALSARANFLQTIFTVKFILNLGSEGGNEKLTVSEIAQTYKKCNKTILNWILKKGLKAEKVVDDYYVSKSELQRWIKEKAWDVPGLSFWVD
jgi:hypothetical protein